MARKTKKKVVRSHTRVQRLLPGLLFFIGLALMSLSGAHWYLRYRSLTLNSQIVAAHQEQEAQEELLPAPVHIQIPWKVDVGIEPAVYHNGTTGVSDTSASYLLQSARPGEQGNIIIYGHNKREIMGNIRAITTGELITLVTESGQEHQYIVTQTHEVSPENTEFLEPTQDEVLTLYTCSGLFDSQRFIVRAIPLQH